MILIYCPLTDWPLQCDFNKASGCFMVSDGIYGVGRGCCDEDGYLIKTSATDTSDPKLCFDLEAAELKRIKDAGKKK